MASTRYSDLRSGYEQKWRGMRLSADRLPDIDRTCRIIEKNRPRYEPIEEKTQCPWYVIGVIHSRESSFNFGTHLHNGDPLTAKTYHVPSSRPLKGKAPYNFTDSAIDAIQLLQSGNWKNAPKSWGLAETLYKLEAYNGFGYAMRGYSNPYLWGGSNMYSKGKYVRDGHYNPNHVDRQLGVATIIQRMVQLGIVTDYPVSSSAPDAPANHGLGCVDPGDGNRRSLSMTNPQSSLEALATALGIAAQSNNNSHEFKAVLNPAADSGVLDIDIQKTFSLMGISPGLDGEVICDEAIFTLTPGGVLEIEVSGYRKDPNAPTPTVYLHDPDRGLNPNALPNTATEINSGTPSERIYKAAQAARGLTTADSSSAGNAQSSAWVVNNLVLARANVKPLGGDSVASIQAALNAGRGKAVARQSAKPGDICLMGNYHVGVCLSDGCTRVLSTTNTQSGKGSFTLDWQIEKYEAFYKVKCSIYRVAQ
ncbi:MAG: hypothetical protein WBB28_01825 [Crinalium sp.]